jgi:hypothetical protein
LAVKRTLLVTAIALLASCDSSIEGVRSFPSPDGQHVIQVITELQAANDPAPWWQHVVLRKSSSRPSLRGSIARFEGREPLEVTWVDPAEVHVVVPVALLQQSQLPSSTTRDGVKIEFQRSNRAAPQNTSNQALERTADRRVDLLSMTSTVKPEATRVLVSGRSACSR